MLVHRLQAKSGSKLEETPKKGWNIASVSAYGSPRGGSIPDSDIG